MWEKFIPRAKERVSLEQKIKTILDDGNEIKLTKTDMWTRKNQYVAEVNWKEPVFSQVFNRLITKIFKKWK